MSTTTQIPSRTTPSAPTPAAERQPVWKHGVASAVVASVATTVLAAIASAAGVSFADSTGASIPIAGFAQLTLVLLARRRDRSVETMVIRSSSRFHVADGDGG